MAAVARVERLAVRADARGAVTEPLDVAMLAAQRNVHLVTGMPGAVRGNHHHRATHEIAVVLGPARVALRDAAGARTVRVPAGEAHRFHLPRGVGHAFRGTGAAPLVVASFTDAPHDPARPDVVREELLAPFAVRAATAADAPMLATTGARLFDETFAAYNDPRDMAEYLAAAFDVEAQRRELADPSSQLWLAMDGASHAIGYLQLRRGARTACIAAERPAEVVRLYVERAWQGAGVADTLVAHAESSARDWGADLLWLGVWERNARAIAFYERWGLAAAGEQPFVLGRDVQRDVVMARRLA
jgi:GNAT superfamily N-acetyltransferase/dTDP-4-dehydrorhamnose 3,5-epimerase-like enzyme